MKIAELNSMRVIAAGSAVREPTSTTSCVR
jgi:hypothetical protein